MTQQWKKISTRRKKGGLVNLKEVYNYCGSEDGQMQSKFDYYTIRGKKDEIGTAIQDTSLLHIMDQCRNFSEQDTQLQYNGRKLGAAVDRTPKCHPELSGERIEYSWGRAKNLYRILKLKYKRGKANFLKSVRHFISHDIITTELVINHYTKARRYIKSYHFLHVSKLNTVEGTK